MAIDIEVIARACRLPGAHDIREFWSVLESGRCTVSEVGPDRWPRTRYLNPRRSIPGKAYTFAAAVLDDIWGFDPAPFNISPREAVEMDPQQRLTLTMVWEALEQAGIPASALARKNVGVYAGASGLDYSNSRMYDPAAADAYFMIGNTLSIVSNRISHAFDLRGPSLTIDTACSSSLVALHHAVTALTAGEIDAAVVVGVNVLLSPFPFIGFSQASMLAQDGRCRPFDAAGSGYVRAEGAVALVLRPTGSSIAPNARALGRIVASRVNSDGHTPGLSLPSAAQQAQLLRDVYCEGGIDPDDLVFVEAHGTGTPAGDPVEASALGQAIGQRRRSPLPIGSVKSNIGHLEPASGLAGLLKAMLALEHDLLPRSLHLETPNPNIDWRGLNLTVANQPLALPSRKSQPRLAGVSTFGFGGTNAHVVIADPVTATGRPRAIPLRAVDPTSGAERTGIAVLSAASRAALPELARRHLELLEENPDLPLADWCAAIGQQRDLLPERTAVVAISRQGVLRELGEIARDAAGAALVSGRAPSLPLTPVFAFAGNGSQWAGMGKTAFARDTSFRQSFEAIDRIFRRQAPWSLVEALHAGDLETRLASTLVAQPLLLACQIATASALEAAGISPGAVVGHSVGEVAAAHIAGAIALDDAVRIIVARSVHQEAIRGTGAMAAVRLSAEAIRAKLDAHGFHDVEIAAINSPASVTIVGSEADIKAVAKIAEADNIFCRVLPLEYPFHSRATEAVRAPLLADLRQLSPRGTRIPFFSTVAGDQVPGTELGAEYWWHNVRRPVAFAAAVAATDSLGPRMFVEIGPRPVLQHYLNECAAGSKAVTRAIPGLRKEDPPDQSPIRRILANAIVNGATVDRERAFGAPSRVLRLPTYPWQNTRLRKPVSDEALADLASGRHDHAILGWRPRRDSLSWHNHLDTAGLPWLADHRVDGHVVLPAAALAEMALAAAREWLDSESVELDDFDLVHPMIFRDGEMIETRVQISPDTGAVEIAGRPRLKQASYQVHAVGRIAPLAAAPASAPARAKVAHGPEIDGASIYRTAAKAGLVYGPAFRRVLSVARVDAETAVATLDDADLDGWRPETPFSLHPVDLDGAFHALLALIDGTHDLRQPYIPARLGAVKLYQAGARPTEVEVRLRRVGPRSIVADFRLYDRTGRPIAAVEGARFVAATLSLRPTLDDVAYHEALERVATGARDAAALDQLILSLHARAAGTSGADPEPRLLLEAAARRVAYDAARAIADSRGTIGLPDLEDRTRGDLVTGLMSALEHAGLAEAEPFGWQLATHCDLPSADLLVRTVLADAPAWSPDCVLLNRAASAIGAVFGEGDRNTALYSHGTLDHFRAGSPRYASAAALAVEAVRHAWPELASRGARFGLVGAGGPAARELVSIARTIGVSLVVFDAEKVELERLAAHADGADIRLVDLSAAEPPSEAERVDLLLQVETSRVVRLTPDHAVRACHALRDGGLVAILTPAPTAFDEVVFGLARAWTDAQETASNDWRTRLGGKEFAEFRECALGERGWSGTLLTARLVARPATIADAGSAPSPTRPAFEILSAGSQVASALAERVGDILLQPSHDAAAAADHAAAQDSGLEIVSFADAETDADPTGALVAQLAALSERLASDDERIRRVWLIAPGALRGDGSGPLPSAVRAAARTIANEYPAIDVRTLDIERGLTADAAAERIVSAINRPGADREILIAGDGDLAVRVRHGQSPARSRSDDDAPDHPRTVLVETRKGSLEAMHWERRPRQAPAPGEVEIELVATGLNFRDVMWKQGLLPDEALEDGFAGPTLGFECAGRVVMVGQGVAGLSVGDHVVALAPSAFSSHVTIPARAASKIPSNVDLVAAATIPVAFLTASYALEYLARLKKGEWVLIHGGAGGVGLAAMQIAERCGARVIATAGTDEKRELLRSLGAEHTLSSRSLRFVDEVREITRDGVDVVLNSLSGRAMERSLELVRPFGRFLELGKRDFYANSKIGLRPFRRNVSYFGIDADQLLAQQPEVSSDLMASLMERFATGELTPLPFRSFDSDRVVDAFRLMQNAGHIGKIVVAAPPESAPARAPHRELRFRGDGAHVIVGGLGGFGLATAEWLVEHGAKTIVLVGRNPRPESDDVAAGLRQLTEQGADVRIRAADVTDAEAVARLLADLRRELPIRGIVHAAMVLDDGLIRSIDRDAIARVVRPKVAGAACLDQHTRGDDLDYFLLYSSATTMIGNPGQFAYVAANGYLEGLAQARREAGLPALAVRWGGITDVGVLARNQTTAQALERRAGLATFKARDALAFLADAITEDDGSVARAVITLAPINWRETRTGLPLLRTPLFERLAALAATASAEVATVDLASLIAGRTAIEAHKIVARHLADELAIILRTPVATIDPERPLAELGMDSLMGFELQDAAERKLGVAIPFAAMSGPVSINSLAAKIVQQVGVKPGEKPADTTGQALAAQHLDREFDPQSLAKLTRTVNDAEVRTKRVI